MFNQQPDENGAQTPDKSPDDLKIVNISSVIFKVFSGGSNADLNTP